MTRTAETSERLATDLKRVVRDSEELLRDSAGAVGEKAHAWREQLAQTLESAKVNCRHLEEKAKQGARIADKTIRDHPYQSMGVGFGIGVLIGVLVSRK